jgi:hypothetical protein
VPLEVRRESLGRFYLLLESLEEKIGGARTLARSHGGSGLPGRGVYFFRENGENRSGSGEGPRIVRVGTHGLKAGSRTTLWNRLSQHRGQSKTGGGNHRGSIFRLIAGTALMAREGIVVSTWGRGDTAAGAVRAGELPLECLVSNEIREMPFLWLEIPDAAGPESLRGYIERNAIALLSNYNQAPIDPPSANWLGRHCDRERVRQSGLWNSNHVDESMHHAFLDEFERLIAASGRTN